MVVLHWVTGKEMGMSWSGLRALCPQAQSSGGGGNIWLGHVLAGYSLFDTSDRINGGRSAILWQDSILSAIESTTSISEQIFLCIWIGSPSRAGKEKKLGNCFLKMIY